MVKSSDLFENDSMLMH